MGAGIVVVEDAECYAEFEIVVTEYKTAEVRSSV